MSNEIERLRAENQALHEELGKSEKETARWAWITTGVAATAILLIIALARQGSTPAAPPRQAEVAACAQPTATPAPKPPAEPEGPPATLPDTSGCRILRPEKFPDGDGKWGAVCGEWVYVILSTIDGEEKWVHKDLRLLPEVVPPP